MSSEKKRFQVVEGPLSVRSEPGAQWVAQLVKGQEIEVDPASRRESGGYVWWKHALGWSAERTLDGTKVLMTEIAAPAVAASKKIFTVTETVLSVRAEPGFNGRWLTRLVSGQQVEVEPDSRREMDGYSWWKHALGWSAERKLDGTEAYMKETAAASAPVIPAVSQPVSPAPAPAVSGKKKTWKVGGQEVRVRRAPGIRSAEVRWLSPGTLLECDEAARVEMDGFVWWQHSEGWTAERSLDGKQVFLVDPAVSVAVSSSAAATVNGLPDESSLPLREALFTRSPVDLDKTLWFQYYGNNNFAYKLWAEGKRWYQYAQGLHGGIDLGNSARSGILIYAGLNGVFHSYDRQYTLPNGLWVTAGDYTVIYGHVANPRRFNPGDPITPDTVMGEIEFGGQNHLHLEVRYRSRWIINPLVLMNKALQEAYMGKFPPSEKYFYRNAAWNKWQSPFDQPVLLLGGPLIGPHAK